MKRDFVKDGFDYLKKAYLVKREGREFIVPTDQLTETELLDIEKKLSSKYEHLGHLDEVTGYRLLKFSKPMQEWLSKSLGLDLAAPA